MKPNPHQILAFACVIQEGSFSVAAQRIGVTQSALSQHIKNLEQEVGARLVTRGSQGPELTRAGAELFELAERFQSVSSELQERLSGLSSFDTGHLKSLPTRPSQRWTASRAMGGPIRTWKSAFRCSIGPARCPCCRIIRSMWPLLRSRVC